MFRRLCLLKETCIPACKGKILVVQELFLLKAEKVALPLAQGLALQPAVRTGSILHFFLLHFFPKSCIWKDDSENDGVMLLR